MQCNFKTNNKKNMNKANLDIIKEIQEKVKSYLQEHSIKALIIGISGGFDSGFNAAILRPICDELNIPLIGTFIHIDSNKKEELERANAIGDAFCTEYSFLNMTEEYNHLNRLLNPELADKDKKDCSRSELIRMGNIKCRLRMIALYNLAQENGGIVVDNDNKTERMLGFWTIGGDIGDITPLASFYKTELYELAKSYVETLSNDNEKEALQSVIDAVPTDGLGITSSDVEQFGVATYNEVDEVLKWIENHSETYKACPYKEESGSAKVWHRWKNSEFKRNHPHRIIL